MKVYCVDITHLGSGRPKIGTRATLMISSMSTSRGASSSCDMRTMISRRTSGNSAS